MSETIKIKKNDLYKVSIAILGVLLIISIFTGGFGLNAKSSNGNAVDGNNGNAGQPVNMKVLENPSLFPVLGPSNAKATVVEFADFQCPFCGMASGFPSWATKYSSGKYANLFGSAGKVEKLAEDGKVRFIYVSMGFLGPESVNAAQAALCANNQGKFWEMHDTLFTKQSEKENSGTFSKANLKIIAKGIDGLDLNKFNSCLDDNETLDGVKTIATIAKQFASGTPTFYVNGKKVYSSWPSIQSAINTA